MSDRWSRKRMLSAGLLVQRTGLDVHQYGQHRPICPPALALGVDHAQLLSMMSTSEPAPDATPTLRGRVRAVALLMAAGTAIGLLDLFQRWVVARNLGADGALPDLLTMIRGHLLPWWLWAAFTPLILYLTRRLPFDRAPWRAVAAHLGWSVVLALGYELVLTLATTLSSSADSSGSTIGQAFRRAVSWRLTVDILTYWAIVAAMQVVEYQRRLRQQEVDAARRDTEAARAQLANLTSRLHPHFLFNTLHTIAALVREQRNRDAVDTIARLSDLLRRVLRMEPTRMIPLDEELEMAYQYLEIEETRFGGRLTIRRSIAAETLDAAVPPFILQPVIENAFRHGFEATDRAGTLTLTSRREGDHLVLLVGDSGRGFAAEPDSEGGLGLSATRQRLAYLFGMRGSVTLGSAEEGGAAVELRIPFVAADRTARESEL